ncbi:hypothetical protein Salat_2376400 [Sesamum alatum]|uniref:Uncharacterized protein n=1 Tax=Sesamum alatum TaxID=300844 RepID=A0AAE1XX48_9LAMI|nr:hypothetical protein Salat_2376400 [Sesamum alatum]
MVGYILDVVEKSLLFYSHIVAYMPILVYVHSLTPPWGCMPILASYLLYFEPSTDRCANCTGHCAKWPLSQSVNGGTGALGISFPLAVGVTNAIVLPYSSSRSWLLSELPSLWSGLTFTNSFLSATNFKA